jgi:hypothetical protein
VDYSVSLLAKNLILATGGKDRHFGADHALLVQVHEVVRSQFEFRAVSLSAISILVLADRQPLVAEGPVIRKFTFSGSRCNGRMVCAQSDTPPMSLSRNVVRGL